MLQPGGGSGDRGGQRAVGGLGESEAQLVFPAGRHLESCTKG